MRVVAQRSTRHLTGDATRHSEHADANIFSVEPSGSAPILSERRPEARLLERAVKMLASRPRALRYWIVLLMGNCQNTGAAIGNIIMIWTSFACEQRPIVCYFHQLCFPFALIFRVSDYPASKFAQYPRRSHHPL
jgi:hypothetical protein